MAVAVLSFLLHQLSIFLREESQLLGVLRDEVQLIKDELAQMKGFLRRAEAMIENNSDLEAWVSQLSDVSYDAEDALDEFILRFGRIYGDGFLGRVRKVYRLIKNIKARHQIATKIRTIKGRIRYISEAHQRYQKQYGIFEQGSSSTVVQNAWYDSRGDALLLEDADLVGIEGSKKELMNLLLSGDSQLRVISVVGMAGLGKTTLVKQVYEDATRKNRFARHAWITVSQSFKIEILLKDTIQQLFKELKQLAPHEYDRNQPAPNELDAMDINSMKQRIRDLLNQESYILVFDDIWRTSDWEAIKTAFPKRNCGSRIMITTRINDVGQAATSDIGGDIYPLEPLTKEQSWTLFCKKAFHGTSCPHCLEEISGNIIERCAGLPLALVVIGSALAIKRHIDLLKKKMSIS